MKKRVLPFALAAASCTGLATSCANQPSNIAQQQTPNTVGNPFMPLWEHIPDGEPYVFEDPDQPGKQRAYLYGSHDSRITDYCGRELVVWSAPVEDLAHWRPDGPFEVCNWSSDETNKKCRNSQHFYPELFLR